MKVSKSSVLVFGFSILLIFSNGTILSKDTKTTSIEEKETTSKTARLKELTAAFSPTNIARALKQQLTSPSFKQFVAYYGVYSAYFALASCLSLLVHELGHGLTAKILGYHPPYILIGFPATRDQKPLMRFKIAGIEILFFPLLVGAVTMIENLNLSNKKKKFIIAAAGPLAGATFDYLALVTLEIFNQLTTNKTIKEAVTSALSNNPMATTYQANINSYASWAKNLKENFPNKTYSPKALYFIQSLFDPAFRFSFIQLLQIIYLGHFINNISNFVPAVGSDGYYLLQLYAGSKPLLDKLKPFFITMYFLINFAPMIIGTYRGLYGDFNARLLQLYIFSLMTNIGNKGFDLITELKTKVNALSTRFQNFRDKLFYSTQPQPLAPGN